MSYSYLTSVFPEFQTTYPNISNIIVSPDQTDKQPKKNVFTGFEENEMTQFAKNLLNQENGYIVPQTKLLEEYSEVNFDKNKKDNKDNLHFYNIPLVDYNQTPLPKKIKAIEGYTDNNSTCDEHMKHILECSLCKSAITKQLQLDNDRIRNEEIMELLSYIAFGIFVLLLIDNIKKK